MHQTQLLNPRKALNKAFLKAKPNRIEIEGFKKNLIQLLDHINENESEEFHKNIVSDFLKNTYYHDRFFINTKGREDLTIYNGKDAKSSAGVIIEAKKPSNKAEMVSRENLNCKAFHELVLYYLRERITGNNLEIKHLIATNINEWFIFDASVFEMLFAKNKGFLKQFADFEEKRLSGTNTDFFYKEIAAPFIEKLTEEITFTWFDLRNIDKILRDANKQNDAALIPYFKIFSPEHLLKLPFSNDSNSLDRSFYNELLHIIGLEETKEGSKKVIGRKAEGKRNDGSLVENTMKILLYDDCLNNIKRSDYGATKEEQLYNVALELVITWINRILFLKLLEGQLVRYHNGDHNYRFLNSTLIPDFDALNKLFFQVLAIREEDRNELVKQKFARIPYLNSSLFEPNDLEHRTIRISNLEDEYQLPVLSQTVLKDHNGKKLSGQRNALQYLFEFLDAYDFSNESTEEIQEENKTLINASVLGLIFEKINGYKDGSFFTPGFITMYMCRETIRRAVVQKLNDAKGWKCASFDELKEDLFEEIKTSSKGREVVRAEANQLVNSLHICDPAVGSGHFLVSALNELIAIKSELRILLDRQGQPLSDYTVEIASDELVITDLNDQLFEYHPANKESQRVQETLFHEKQTLIENCLFGVDINPNSVKICRLRLWIELLKNAYYKSAGDSSPLGGGQVGALETLPNIDINIKCGNSLISRYALDADIKKALKSSKWTIDSYRVAVQSYREAKSKEVKHNMQRLIDTIKNDFESEVAAKDKRLFKLNKLRGELFAHSNQQGLFALNKTEQKAFDAKAQKLVAEIKKLETELDEIRKNAIYENAFEWRFEFPEVLNDEGDFVGFDVVIGNPPYKLIDTNSFSFSEREFYSGAFDVSQYKPDLYHYFLERSYLFIKPKGDLMFILPSTWMTQKFTEKLRGFVLANYCIKKVIHFDFLVFDEADVFTEIILLQKTTPITKHKISFYRIQNAELNFTENDIKEYQNVFLQREKQIIDIRSVSPIGKFISNILESNPKLEEIARASLGCQAYNSSKHTKEQIKERVFHADVKVDDSYMEELAGSDVGRYYHQRKKGQWIKYGNWLHDYRSIDWLTGGRILIREVSGKAPHQIQATYLEEAYCNYKTILNVSPKLDFKYSMKLLCGILNSSLISFIFSNVSNKIQADTFPRVSVSDLKVMPIKLPKSNEEINISNTIEHIVDQILVLKSQNPAADTTALEAEIDIMVYKLYNLTWEEVKIVDPEFGMSEEEYERMSEL